MARQGGRVQLQQSYMRFALNMVTMAQQRLLRAAIKESQHLIKKPRARVREETRRRVAVLGYNKVTAAIERHLVKFRENQTDSCLPCQNGTEKNPQTRGRRKGTCAPLPRPVPSRLGTPAAQPDDSETTRSSETEGVPPRYVYINTLLPSARFCNLDSYAKDHMRDTDFITDLLIDEGPSTG